MHEDDPFTTDVQLMPSGEIISLQEQSPGMLDWLRWVWAMVRWCGGFVKWFFGVNKENLWEVIGGVFEMWGRV